MHSVILVLVFCSILYCNAFVLQDSKNVTTVIQQNGYPIEVHLAPTEDHYLLTIHRIPHGRNNTKATRGPVLLQHGLTDSSAGWCLNSPSESLAYLLADAGYDVWLGNNRGNGYSLLNTQYPPSNPAFWDFSWDEMALIDFPTTIKYVLTATNSKKLSYIGHSEGTIQAFGGLISDPSLANSLNVFIGLAPVAYVGHLTAILPQILARLDGDQILKLLGVHEFYLPDALHILLPELCKVDPPSCEFGSTYIFGKDTYLNQTRLDLYTQYEPFPTSVKNMIHWAQGVRTSTFTRFDYGRQGNIAHYNQPTPPVYEFSKYPKNIPTVLFTGGIDGLADPQDVQRLLAELPIVPTVYDRPEYGHIDPLLGDTAFTLTYPNLMKELAKYSGKY